nr:MAG TPA: hypothetical protein [Caudoviricetes sp.]
MQTTLFLRLSSAKMIYWKAYLKVFFSILTS